MHHFQSLKVNKVIKETNDSVHISLEIPESLRHEFQFQQGQYLNVRFDMNGRFAPFLFYCECPQRRKF
jgi:ring-1,2-phenylacetyl-CoA epoxidase subunit PaaE